MKQGNQLVAHRSGFEHGYINRKGMVPESINEMNAEAIVFEKKIADAQYEDFRGRRQRLPLIVRLKSSA